MSVFHLWNLSEENRASLGFTECYELQSCYIKFSSDRKMAKNHLASSSFSLYNKKSPFRGKPVKVARLADFSTSL